MKPKNRRLHACAGSLKSGAGSETVNGILADNDVIGQVAQLVEMMQEPEWAELWAHLGLALCRFEDIGLPAHAADSAIWNRCQESGLFVTPSASPSLRRVPPPAP